MLNIAVVEDDADHRRTVVNYLRDFLTGREAYSCLTFEDGADFLAANLPQLDIVFLDIMMARSNGLEVARQLRERDANVAIIFITEAVQYALEGYGVHACDFLVKPLYYTSFCASMQRALALLTHRAPTMMQVRYDKTCVLLDVAGVIFVETQRKGTLIHTRMGDYPCSDSMAQLEERLGNFGFARCHQAYLVNLAFVESVRKQEVLVCGHALPLSRHRREDFIALLLERVGDTI